MAHVSPTELMSVLKSSGLPFGNSQQMQEATPFAKGPLSETVRSADPISQQLWQQRKAQLDKIAQMDQKLAGVYGDPSSKLFIEHPLKRESAIGGARKVGQRAVSDIETQQKQHEKELDETVSESLTLYKQLEAMQLKEEKQTEKLNKKGESEAKKKQKEKQKEIDAQRKNLGIDITDKAKIFNRDARNLFLSKPTAFQKAWLRMIALSPMFMPHPKEGYSSEDIRKEFEDWEKKNKPTVEQKKEEKKSKRQPLF